MFEAGAYAGGHTNTVRVDTAARDARRRHRLHRLQRPQLPELRAPARRGSASPRSRRHELRGQRRGAATSSTRHVAERPVRQARAPRDAVVPADGRRRTCASTARRATLLAIRRPGPSLGDWLEERALLARVRRPADRAAGGRGLVGRPARRCGASPRASCVEFFDNHGMLGLRDRPQWRTVARRLAALRRGARRAVARPPAARRRRSTRSSATTTTSRSRRAAASPSASTRSCSPTHSDQALAMLADATRPRARAARRDPLPAQRGGAAHRRAAAAAPPPRVGELELPPARRRRTGKPTVTYHMNRLQSLRADREFCVTLNRTEAIDPGKMIRTIPYAHPVFTRRGPGGAGAPRRDQRAATARTTAAPTGAGASTRTAWSARCAWPSGSGSGGRVTHSASTRARSATAASRCASHEFRHRDRAGLPRPRRAAAAARRPARPRAAPASCASAAPTTSATRRAARRRGPRAGRASAPARAPDGPDPPAHPPAHVRPLLQPGQLLLLLRRGRRAAATRSSPR